MNSLTINASGVDTQHEATRQKFKARTPFQISPSVTAEYLFKTVLGVRDFWVLPKAAGHTRQWVAVSELHAQDGVCLNSYSINWKFALIEHLADGTKVVKNTSAFVGEQRSREIARRCTFLHNDLNSAYVAACDRTWDFKNTRAASKPVSVHPLQNATA